MAGEITEAVSARRSCVPQGLRSAAQNVLGGEEQFGFRNSSVRSDGILRHRRETCDCATASLTRDCKTRNVCM